MSLRACSQWLGLICCAVPALQAIAIPTTIDIPAGPLSVALDTLSRRAGTQVLYQPQQVEGVSSPGAHGAAGADQALEQLLRGTGLMAHRDASGAVLLQPAPASTPATTPWPQAARPRTPAPIALQAIKVTGSRIARSQVEGPAPLAVITAEQIQAGGFSTVPQVLRAMTQNIGQTQSEQSLGNADYSPGSQQVDLRGLGPNHTLVLVNGQRIADFPMPFMGRSNFADVSGLPLGLIERIEVLTGSGSAVYGSDAIAGVINFILKQRADGTTVDAHVGQTDRGDAQSLELAISSGYSHAAFDGIFGLQLTSRQPLWAYQRSRQDSTRDATTERAAAPRRTFLRTDASGAYLDPGESVCAPLEELNGNSTGYSARPGQAAVDPATGQRGPGYYCGSPASIGYGTVLNRRQGFNAHASLRYALDASSHWFAELQFGSHAVSLLRDVPSWAYMDADGNEQGDFYNRATGQVEYWSRQFTPEEMGGLARNMIDTRQKTLSIATGIKGQLGQAWSYETTLSHSQYRARISWPRIVAARANGLFLGQPTGTDPGSTTAMFDADPARLYAPLRRDEYEAIAERTQYTPRSRTDTLSATLTNTQLGAFPGGNAALSVTAEVGGQSYDLHPDPLATQYYYYSWRDADGSGSRDRWALASELRLPATERLNVSLAGRYDQYRYTGRHPGRFTWNAGLEWRPRDSLLLRGSYGPGFRAPDLHYLYAGEGNDEATSVDYYRCATQDAQASTAACRFNDESLVRRRRGNRDLKAETSTAWTAGVVWSPQQGLDLSMDYFSIDMRDQVQDLRVDRVLRDEADCRLGQRDPASSACRQAVERVERTAEGALYAVSVAPINVARETTSGVDASLRYRIQTRAGALDFIGSYTLVHQHRIQLQGGGAIEDAFAVNSGYDAPRTKANATLLWSRNAWAASLQGQRLGRLPSEDSSLEIYQAGSGASPWIAATYRFNGTLQYRFNARAQVSLAATNLFDAMPPVDRSATVYPYYDTSWFDTTGRRLTLQYTQKFGGTPLY
ncbi:TonB-dependent receptor [Acidovorax sp. SUPP2539]|uniref:TonB-dependent receptor n=1 Tax=Acidovorax sp. SUPP2539 TaxID=2920878 RepID=UPI0023DE5007|nr:TonB-dependent receptor [Acidovorax sp. SUPP2539]GKS88732.1 TonB-dependent receptor [Acidovorax sp. SUPP2539]